MLPFLDVLQYLVLALWVGAMFSFAALFAPVLFRLSETRAQAGQVAGETLSRIDSLGLVAAGILVVITALQAIDTRWQAIDLARFFASVLMLTLVLISAMHLRQRIQAIRAQMSAPIDSLAEDDPLRVEHTRYHRFARLVFSINILLGTLLIVLSALRLPL